MYSRPKNMTSFLTKTGKSCVGAWNILWHKQVHVLEITVYKISGVF